MAVIVFFTQMIIPFSPLLKLIISILIGFGIVISFSKIFDIDGYTELKNIIMELKWRK